MVCNNSLLRCLYECLFPKFVSFKLMHRSHRSLAKFFQSVCMKIRFDGLLRTSHCIEINRIIRETLICTTAHSQFCPFHKLVGQLEPQNLNRLTCIRKFHIELQSSYSGFELSKNGYVDYHERTLLFPE